MKGRKREENEGLSGRKYYFRGNRDQRLVDSNCWSIVVLADLAEVILICIQSHIPDLREYCTLALQIVPCFIA